jgi:hypothetical protein
MREVRRDGIQQGVDSVVIENVYVSIHDLSSLCAGPARVGTDALVDAVEENERPELLAAVRDVAGWLADLEGELIRVGAGEQHADPTDREGES